MVVDGAGDDGDADGLRMYAVGGEDIRGARLQIFVEYRLHVDVADVIFFSNGFVFRVDLIHHFSHGILVVIVEEVGGDDDGDCTCCQGLFDHFLHIASGLLGVDQSLRKSRTVEMTPCIVNADHHKDVVGAVGENVAVKAVQEHFRGITADGGVEIMDVIGGKICPGVDENAGHVAISHFSEAVTDWPRSVAVGDAVTRKHNGFDLMIHDKKTPFGK